MDTNLDITPSDTTVLTDLKNDYPVVPERLIRIDDIDYVRCELHGLMPLLHKCADSPHDHWCREAAHPNYNPEDGDQGRSHADESTHQSLRVHHLTDALLRACLYLDGFIWLHDPEASELDDIKETVAHALGMTSWTEASVYAKRKEDQRKGYLSSPDQSRDLDSADSPPIGPAAVEES
jgi:hypothetical protein